MTEIQTTILKSNLLNYGICETKATRLIDMLANKPKNVQLTFYYRCLGETHKTIAEILGVSRRQVGYYLSRNLNDIKEYLKIS